MVKFPFLKNPIKIKRKSLLYNDTNNNIRPVLGNIKATIIERAYGKFKKHQFIHNKIPFLKNNLKSLNYINRLNMRQILRDLTGWKNISTVNSDLSRTVGPVKITQKAIKFLDSLADDQNNLILTAAKTNVLRKEKHWTSILTTSEWHKIFQPSQWDTVFKNRIVEQLNGHAYSISNIDKERRLITLKNPHNTVQLSSTISYEKFFKDYYDIAGVKAPTA